MILFYVNYTLKLVRFDIYPIAFPKNMEPSTYISHSLKKKNILINFLGNEIFFYYFLNLFYLLSKYDRFKFKVESDFRFANYF
jgi:hypothetical protein